MPGRKCRLAIGLAAALAATASAAVANAANRYASPTGSGTACTPGSPCSIYQAVGGAMPADTVKLNSGTHTLTTAGGDLFIGNVTVEPTDPGTHPEIASTTGQHIVLSNAGTLIRDLRINLSGSSPSVYLGYTAAATATRIEMVFAGASTSGVLVRQGGTFSDSTVWSDSAFATAVISGMGGGTVRNVSAVATGMSSHGLSALGTYGSPQTVTLQNSILQGTANDIFAVGMAGDSITVNVQNSNYDTPSATAPAVINELSGQQTTPPFFLFLSAGDLHQISSSTSTIDDGMATASVKDVDGQIRNNEAATDIGGDEIVAPIPPTLTTTSPASPANDNNPEIFGLSDPALVSLFKDPGCAVLPVAATGTHRTLASPGLTVNVADNTTTNFNAQASLGPGYTSGCAAGLEYRELTPPPLVVPPAGPAAPTSVTPAKKKCKRKKKRTTAAVAKKKKCKKK